MKTLDKKILEFKQFYKNIHISKIDNGILFFISTRYIDLELSFEIDL